MCLPGPVSTKLTRIHACCALTVPNLFAAVAGTEQAIFKKVKEPCKCVAGLLDVHYRHVVSFVPEAARQQFACRWVSKEDLARAVTASKDTAAYGAPVLKCMPDTSWPSKPNPLTSLPFCCRRGFHSPRPGFLHSSRLGNCTSSHKDVGYFAKSLVFKAVATCTTNCCILAAFV